MTLVKWNNGNSFNTSLATIFDDFFDRDFNTFNGGVAIGTKMPAVNISEEENSFEVEVAAPGLKKNDFKVNLNNNVLTISSESSHEHKDEDKKKITRREFSYSSFERSFSLPDSINGDKIHADYKDGVLKISLPKKEEAKHKAPKQIQIG